MKIAHIYFCDLYLTRFDGLFPMFGAAPWRSGVFYIFISKLLTTGIQLTYLINLMILVLIQDGILGVAFLKWPQYSQIHKIYSWDQQIVHSLK